MFDIYDSNNDGELDRSEIRFMLENLGTAESASNVKAMVRKLGPLPPSCDGGGGVFMRGCVHVYVHLVWVRAWVLGVTATTSNLYHTVTASFALCTLAPPFPVTPVTPATSVTSVTFITRLDSILFCSFRFGSTRSTI